MQLAVKIHVAQHLGAICLEGGSEVAQFHAGSFRHHPVGDARRDFAQKGIIHAMLTPSAGDVEAFIDLGEQRRNILGRVLQIAIHRDDDVALRFVESRGERRGLSEVAAQADYLEPSIGLHQIREQLETAIRGSVVHEQNLVASA